MTNQEMLSEFHKTAGQANSIELRKTLISEEHEELMEALDEGDMHHIAKEMADVLYVVYGTADYLNIDLDVAFKEVHRSNMHKAREGVRREDGKIIKPANYIPPDMSIAVTGSFTIKGALQ